MFIVLEHCLCRSAGAGRAEPQQFYDNSLIKELDDSGFIGALFGKTLAPPDKSSLSVSLVGVQLVVEAGLDLSQQHTG